MSRVGYVGIAVALALVSTSALAFQEEGGAAVVAPSPDVKSAPAEPGLDFSVPPRVDGGNSGTEVRIPGLGRLGVLPKMDFGLELLYGANSTNDVKKQEPELPASDDLTIRGTVKHNF